MTRSIYEGSSPVPIATWDRCMLLKIMGRASHGIWATEPKKTADHDITLSFHLSTQERGKQRFWLQGEKKRDSETESKSKQRRRKKERWWKWRRTSRWRLEPSCSGSPWTSSMSGSLSVKTKRFIPFSHFHSPPMKKP